MPEVPKCWSVNNCFRWNLSQPWYIIHQHADLPPTFITLCTHVGTGRVPSYKRCVFTLQSILHSRPSWTMRSPGACRKCGRKWRSWMLSFSSPLSLDLDLGLTDRRKQTFYYFEFICISKRWNFNKNLDSFSSWKTHFVREYQQIPALRGILFEQSRTVYIGWMLNFSPENNFYIMKHEDMVTSKLLFLHDQSIVLVHFWLIQHKFLHIAPLIYCNNEYNTLSLDIKTFHIHGTTEGEI